MLGKTKLSLKTRATLKSVKTDLGLVWLFLRTNSMLFCEQTVYSFLGTWIRGENYLLLTFLR